jgi:nitroreductase
MLDAGVLQPGTPEWLSLTFAGGKARWLAEMRDTLALDRVEPGVINLPTDLRDVNVADQTSSSRSFTVPTGRTGLLMLARAIQLWNRGDEREAVTLLVETLSLSRLMRRQATVSTYRVGLDLEKRAAACLGQWAWHRGRVGPSKEERLALFREALQELATNEAEAPPVASALQAEYVAANNALSLLDTSNLTNLADVRNRFSLLRQAPWEKARAQRLVDAVFAGWLRAFARGYPEAPKPSADILSAGIAADAFPLGAWEAEDGTGPDGPAGQKLSRLVAGSWVVEKLCRETAALQRAEFDARCRRGGTRLILALALYESEHGKSAQRLADLPGDYFPAGLPLDPYSGESFRYRVTTGAETLIGEPRGPGSPERRLSAGQGVVYSVGPDGVDDGGKQHGGELKPGQAVDSSDGLDLLFLVPRSAAGRGPRL